MHYVIKGKVFLINTGDNRKIFEKYQNANMTNFLNKSRCTEKEISLRIQVQIGVGSRVQNFGHMFKTCSVPFFSQDTS